jgi:citrate synthase
MGLPCTTSGYIDNHDQINIDQINMTSTHQPARISAVEAAVRLGVKRETIYAYVSRGMLNSERHIDGKSSTFDPAEIERFRRNKNDRRPGRLDVSVASAITEVTNGSVAYRGHALAQLVHAGHHYEEVAELLWTGSLGATGSWPPDDRVRAAVQPAVDALLPTATAIDRMMAGVVAAAAADPFRNDRSLHGMTSSGRILTSTIVDALPVAARSSQGERLAERLWRRLARTGSDQWPLLNLAMVLLADHGMATSTLAARLAASTRSGPHAVLLAGLGAVAGPLHGAASRVVHELFADAELHGPEVALATVIQRDGKVPGIGHFIHRSTDPRHDLLMERLAETDLDQQRMDVVASIVSLTSERIPVAPNVDLALGALTYIAGMPPDAGEVIFAIARTAGWLAHALEEYDETPIRFRPVGRYVASPPPHRPSLPLA